MFLVLQINSLDPFLSSFFSFFSRKLAYVWQICVGVRNPIVSTVLYLSDNIADQIETDKATEEAFASTQVDTDSEGSTTSSEGKGAAAEAVHILVERSAFQSRSNLPMAMF